jgi:hypothetical protein
MYIRHVLALLLQPVWYLRGAGATVACSKVLTCRTALDGLFMPAKAWCQYAVVDSQLFAGVVLCAQAKLTLRAAAQQGTAVHATT